MQGRVMRLTSAAVAVVLAAVGLTSGWAVLEIRSAVTEMAAATTTLRAYSILERAVAAEAFAEASYRRAPSERSRAKIEASISGVAEAVANVREVGSSKDQAVLSYVAMTNTRYASQVRASLDAPVTTAAQDTIAGPALDSIQNLLDGAVFGRRAEMNDARDRQLALIHTLMVVFPVVIGTSLLGLTVCWRVLWRDQRLLRETAADHEHRSLHDPLTGLANRLLFSQGLAAALRPGKAGTAVLFVDLDDFKRINDSLGHDVGDQLLMTIAERLTESVSDALVARLGGDEFAILLAAGERPEVAADRILANLARPVVFDGHVVLPGASIGIAVAPADGHEPRELLRSADDALYLAKAAGKGTWSRTRFADLDGHVRLAAEDAAAAIATAEVATAEVGTQV